MGIGREVADAYISVHGDLSDFRKDLAGANKDVAQAAKENADSFSDAWGKRMADDLDRQWNSVVNSMYSGTKLDFTRMVNAFDPTDLDSASEKIHTLIGDMEELGNITGAESEKIKKAIDTEIKARQQAFFAQKDHADQQRGWDEAHRQMMEQLSALRKRDSDQALADFTRMQNAQDTYNKSFESMFRANRMSDLTKDFETLTRAMGDMDFSKFAKGFDDFDAARDRVVEVTQAMNEMGRISDDNADRMIAGIDRYITAETDRRNLILANEDAIQKAKEQTARFAEAESLKLSQANGRALAEAKALLAEQERYNRSFEGMGKIASAQKLEQDFRNLSAAVHSNDWSTFARGANNVKELRARTMETANAMFDLGRVGYRGLADIEAGLSRATSNMREANISFDEGSTKVRTFHGALSRATGMFGKLFTLSKGFREHLGGFAGINIFGDMIREGLDFIHNLDRIAVSAALATTKLATMASIGGSSLLSLVTIAADLGPILAGLGAALPGFAVGAGISIGVLVASFKDMKKVLGDLQPAFAKLQDGISAKFWAEAAQPIRDMVKTLLPTLTTQLNGTATSLGGFFAATADAVKNIPVPYLEQMFSSMNKGIDIAKGAMAPLVKTFTTLGLAASMYFERFGTWLVKLSTDFNNFINAAAQDGRLLGWIDAMIEGFKNIGRAIDGVFGIFNALDSAASAAGFGGLATFASNLQGIAAAMQSTGAQTTMTQLFSGMLILVEKVGAAIGNLGQPLASIMPTINLALSAIGGAVAQVIGYVGQIMADPTVQAGITNFTNGIATAIDKLAPAIAPFAASLGNVMTLLGLILVNVAEIVSAFMVNLSPVLDQMSAQFQTLVQPLGDAVLNLITAITPVAQAINDNLIGPLVSGIRDQVLPGFNAMVTTLAPVAAQMVAALGPVLQSILPLVPPIMQLATTIGTVLMQAVTAVAPLFVTLMGALMPIVGAIMNLVNIIAPFLVPAIQQIVTALTPVIEVIGQVVGVIVNILAPVLGFLIIGVINNVVGAIHGFSEVFMAVVGIITALITGFGAFFTKLFQGDIGGALEALGTMFGDIWNNIMQLIGGALEFIWNAVQLLFIGKLVGGVKSALTSMGGFFKSVWEDIVRLVKGAIDNVASGVNSGLATAKNFVLDALNAMVNFFRSGWDNMVSAVSNGIGAVISWVGGIGSRIMSAIGNAGNILVGAGKAIIDGFLQGLKDAWGAVTSFVGGIADWIAKNKGPLPYDRQLLVPAGRAIMEGLGAGLEGQMSNLLSTLHAITDGMTNAVVDAFARSKMYLAGADAAMGLADGLSSNKSAVLTALGDLAPQTNLGAKITAVGSGGVGGPTPSPAKVVTIEAGAISLQTNTQSPQIAADMLLDSIVNEIV